MAYSINKVILVGNVGNDPEMKTFQSGDKVINFSVATSESWKDKESGEQKSITEWHKVAIFNNALVDIADKFVKKGMKVYIEGQLQTRKWQDKEGKDRWTTEVLGNQLTMLGSRNTSDSSEEVSNSSNTPFPEDDSGPGLTDDDIPF